MLTLLGRILVIVSICIMVLRIAREVVSLIRPRRRMSQPPPANTAAMVRDPVCGMYLDPDVARRHTARGTFFCSDECRRKFLSAAG